MVHSLHEKPHFSLSSLRKSHRFHGFFSARIGVICGFFFIVFRVGPGLHEQLLGKFSHG